MPNQLVTSKIKKQARHWVCCLNRGLSPEEKPQLIAWVNQSPSHHYALYKVASFFDDISELNTLNGIFPLENSPKTINYSPIKWLITVIISLVSIFVVLSQQSTLFEQSSPGSSVQTYLTQIGEISTVRLPDGSQVKLNTHTKIRVEYSEHHRAINLLYGEAQFEVAKDSSRPFTVTSGAKSFTALGTIFNIQKNNESDMELIVNEGQVLISDASVDHQLLSEIIAEEVTKIDSSKIITSGEKSIINNAALQQKVTLSHQQADKELAWQQGMLVFNGETLLQALNEVSRYSNVQFEIIDNHIGKVKVAGYFKAGDIDGLLAALSYNFGIKSKFNATNSVQLSSVN